MEINESELDIKLENTNLDAMMEKSVAPNKRKRIIQNRKIKFKWTDKQVISLIFEVRIRDALWNCFDSQYNHPKTRDALWNEVTQRLKIDKIEVRNKWHSIRNTYRMMYIKLKSANNESASMKESYGGVYQYLVFLEPTLQLKSIQNEPVSDGKTSPTLSIISIDSEEEGTVIEDEDVLMSSPLPLLPATPKSEHVEVVNQCDDDCIEESVNNMMEQIVADREKTVQKSKMKVRIRERRINYNWTNGQVLSLISEVKCRPALWNCFDPKYKYKKIREAIWVEVSQRLNIDLKEIRNKWNSIRNKYRMLYIKLINSDNERAASKKNSYNGFYRYLIFLGPTLQNVSNNESMNVSDTPRSISTISIDTEDSLDSSTEEGVNVPSTPLPAQPTFSKSERAKVVEENGEGGKEHGIGPPDNTTTTDSWNEIGQFIAMNGRRWGTTNRRLEAKFRSALYKLVSDIELEAAMDCYQ